jgi:trehalose 6-phosphate synthase
MSRLVCVSNRLTLPKRDAAPGGLAVGVLSTLKQTGGLWFGWGGEITDTDPGEPDIHIREGVTYATIALKRREFERYYNGYANDALWPLFHYFVDRFRYSAEHHDAYQSVNRTFAQKLAPLLGPDDIIWVHDYHLIPLARRLRELGVKRPIGFFLHIPFPYVEVLKLLPMYSELLRDLTSYDVVGFQTQTNLQAFHSGIVDLCGKESILSDGRITVSGRRLTAGVFPIGVDVDGVQAEAATAEGGDMVRRMIESILGRQLMIGVDRLDYSKGLVQRFNAYRQFLESYPEQLNRVSFIQIAPLSRTDVRAYAEIRERLEQASGRTNGRFADTDWTPIRYLNRNFAHDELMGFLRAADVCLVTSLRDGMNLVAKEFVAAQDAMDPGVLILSPFAGAARELTAALQVNPYDARALAHAMQSALTMPLTERRERHATMLEQLRQNDLGRWSSSFVTALDGYQPCYDAQQEATSR